VGVALAGVLVSLFVVRGRDLAEASPAPVPEGALAVEAA
jgi:hypothetical protein